MAEVTIKIRYDAIGKFFIVNDDRKDESQAEVLKTVGYILKRLVAEANQKQIKENIAKYKENVDKFNAKKEGRENGSV